MDNNLIKQLAEARQKAEVAKESMDAMLAKVKAVPGYQLLEQGYQEAQIAIGELESEIRTKALDQFTQDGNKHPSAAIEIKEFPVVFCESSDTFIRKWCLTNLPGALRVDRRTFDKAVINGFVDIAHVEKEARVQIKRDLSEWL